MKLRRLCEGGPRSPGGFVLMGTVSRGDLFADEDGVVRFLTVEAQRQLPGEGEYSSTLGYPVLVMPDPDARVPPG